MKTFCKIVVIIFLWCHTATAESVLPPCQGEDSMQWTNCYGSYNYRDVTDYILKKFPKVEELYPNSYYTENYDGEFGSQPGLKHGYGIRSLYLNSEIYSTYEGKYFDDQRNGQGTHTYANGNKFVGEYKDGTRNGQGTYTYANGNKFVGEYKDGEENGQGTYTYANGDKFVGEFKDGKENGQGTYIWADGDKFVGEFKDGKENGQGTYIWADGDKFVGEFKDGKENGQGTFTWANGDEEVAIYKDNEIVKIITSTCPISCRTGCITGDCKGGSKEHTIGTYVYDNGDAYVGQWLFSEPYGEGVYTFSDGTTKEGIWSSGDLIYQCMEGNCINGKGLMENKENGEVYFGDLKNYKANGEGVLTFTLDKDQIKNGNKYSGEFKNHKYHGTGTLEWVSGSKYIGEFKDGYFHGKYTYVYGKDGSLEVGEYEDGSKKDGVHTAIFPDGTELKTLYEFGTKKKYLFKNESEKEKFLIKVSKKNKIKENAELKCVDKRGDSFTLILDKSKNQIFLNLGTQKMRGHMINLNANLNYILKNNDRTIIAAGVKKLTVEEKTAYTNIRIELDKYNGDLLISVEEIDENGFQYINTLRADSSDLQDKSKGNCQRRVLN